MTITSIAMPKFEEPLMSKGRAHSSWYRFWQGLRQGQPPGSEMSVTPAASPYTFLTQQRGFLIVNGGTVSMVQFSRGGTTNYVTGQTQGVFPVSAGDSLILTYSGIPSLTFVPQ